MMYIRVNVWKRLLYRYKERLAVPLCRNHGLHGRWPCRATKVDGELRDRTIRYGHQLLVSTLDWFAARSKNYV